MARLLLSFVAFLARFSWIARFLPRSKGVKVVWVAVLTPLVVAFLAVSAHSPLSQVVGMVLAALAAVGAWAVVYYLPEMKRAVFGSRVGS